MDSSHGCGAQPMAGSVIFLQLITLLHIAEMESVAPSKPMLKITVKYPFPQQLYSPLQHRFC